MSPSNEWNDGYQYAIEVMKKFVGDLSTNPSIDERPSNDNEAVCCENGRPPMDEGDDHYCWRDGYMKPVEYAKPVSTPPRSQEDVGPPSCEECGHDPDEHYDVREKCDVVHCRACCAPDYRDFKCAHAYQKPVEGSQERSEKCWPDDEHRHVDGDGDYIWHAHRHTEPSKPDARRVNGFDERNHHDPAEHTGHEQARASGWIEEPYAGAPKPVAPPEQERSETGGEWTRLEADGGSIWRLTHLRDYEGTGLLIPASLERAISRDAEERARGRVLDWETATEEQREFMISYGLMSSVRGEPTIRDYRLWSVGVSVGKAKAEERATQAEGQREALEREVARLRTAGESYYEYACFNAAGEQVSGVGTLAHMRTLAADPFTRTGDHIRQRVVRTVRDEWGALSPSTEATPSESTGGQK